jgi:hypothetical protein
MIIALNLKDDGESCVLGGFHSTGVAMAFLRNRYGTEAINDPQNVDVRSGYPLVVQGVEVAKLIAVVYDDEHGRMLPGQMDENTAITYSPPRY